MGVSCHDMKVTDQNPAGGRVIAIDQGTLFWAVDQMVEKLGPEQLTRLDVRAGEVLSAILTTSFLGIAPMQVDTHGGVDLSFEMRSAPQSHPHIFPNGLDRADFEVKSLPGEFRKLFRRINRDQKRGLEVAGSTIHVTIRTVEDIMQDARSWITLAKEQLERKSNFGASRNVFLVVHPFEHLALECLHHNVIASFLEPLNDISGVDTVWVLWVPDHMTMWSRYSGSWTDMLFGVMDPEDVTQQNPGEPNALQQAEQYFLTRIGNEGESPYIFGISE